MRKSIVKVGYSTITYSETAGYTYGAPTWFESDRAGGREVKASPRGENTEVYADGIVALSANDNDGYDIDITLLDIVDNIETDWFGNTADGDSQGIAEYSTGAAFPQFALIVVYSLVGGGYETEYYYQCRAQSRPETGGKTSEGKFEAAFFSCKLRAYPREHDEPARRLVRYVKRTTALPTAVAVPGAAVQEE